MRCKYQISLYVDEEVIWIEEENGKILFLRLMRPVKVKQQCQVTTRQKHNKCWSLHGMCGNHAALMFPHLYPKAKGHPTGGRHGLENKSFNKNISLPWIEN